MMHDRKSFWVWFIHGLKVALPFLAELSALCIFGICGLLSIGAFVSGDFRAGAYLIFMSSIGFIFTCYGYWRSEVKK